MLLAIDPGNVQSAWILFDEKNFEVKEREIERNSSVAERLKTENFSFKPDEILIEYPFPRGQPMFTQLVDTICWIGRFANACGEKWRKMDRKDVKMHLCGTTRARDSNVRAAIYSMFAEKKNLKTKKELVGNAKSPGPLYGVRKDIWAALGLAVTKYLEKKELDKFLS